MPQQLYTPFMSKAGATIGNAMMRRGEQQREQESNQLFQQAYMGDQQALQQLAGVNPQAAMQVEQVNRKRQQDRLAVEGAGRKRDVEKQEILGSILGEAAKLDTFEEFTAEVDRQAKSYESVIGPQPSPTEEVYLSARERLGYTEGAKVGAVSPKDFTVESMARYADTGNIGDLVRYTPQVKEIAGIPHQYNPSTLKWEPLVDMRGEGIASDVAASAELDADRASRLDFGKQKDAWENNQAKHLNNISAAEQKQTVITNTADKIKDLVSGWSTQYGASLSSIPGSEARTLKGLIDTMKANSAFTTLTELKSSGGTLGAISEAELNLLERAWGALDQGGDSAEFARVLDQLVGQNAGSLQRLRNGYSMNKKRFSGSYDDSQRQQQDENTVSWDDL